MKKEYSTIPASMESMQTYGFHWMDFVTAIPSPLFVVTSYKSNGRPNACLQSWSCFGSRPEGFYAILSSVNKSGHLYQTVKQHGEVVLNFPSADYYDRCYATIRHNQFDDDEIALSGLLAEPAATVQAPRIKECFLNLECRFLWEKDIIEGDSHALLCFEICHISADQQHLEESDLGRYGESGYLYNIHYPVNPETYQGTSRDAIAVLHKLREMSEY